MSPSGLLGPLFRWDAIEDAFDDRARVQGMLDFEAALARAMARTGLVPPTAAAAISAQCRAEHFDLDGLAREGALAGNPAIPLVRQLTARVAAADAEAARFVHWGATSQDAMDTGLVLQLGRARLRVLAELDRLCDALFALADHHRTTVIAGRTWMQQAAPTTFGLKAAGWLDAVGRDRDRLFGLAERVLVLQFGGAVGNLAALGERGREVARLLAEELGLPEPALPWHTHRDRIAELASAIGIATGTLGKIARDISLPAQTEIAEVFESHAPGRGGSSTLPQKRNPVGCAVVLAAATRTPGLVAALLSAMVQEQERALSGWQAEWELLPELFSLYGGALHRMTETILGLRVDAARMAANLEATRGLIQAEAVQMALAERTGRGRAHEIVQAACARALAENRHLHDVLAADPLVAPHIPAPELALLFDPRRSLGVTAELIDRALTAHASRRGARKGAS